MTPRTSVQTQVHLVPVSELPAGAPALVVVDGGDGSPVRDLFRLPAPSPAPAGRPLRLLVRTATVNSPDRVAVLSAWTEDRCIGLDVERRAFEGLLGANVQSIAVVEARVGPLAAGDYDVELTLHRLGFRTIDHPEQAEPRETSTRTWRFTLVP